MPPPAFQHDSITDRVRAGRNPLSADDVQALIDEGITHVLDLREPLEWSHPWLGQEALDAIVARGLVRKHLPIEDCSAPTLATLDQAVAFIDEALADPGARVYVHCRAGLERTACVLVAWHARGHAAGYEESLAALRRRRGGLWPLPEQEAITREWIRARVEGSGEGDA